MTSRQKYLAAQARYNHSEKGRERWRAYAERRRSDPDYRRKKSVYMIGYRARRQREQWLEFLA